MEHLPPESPKPAAKSGLGGLFEGKELKSFFGNYLITVAVIEGLIFFVCFVTGLASEDRIFPWKAYIFASFAAPLALTFVFAVIVLTFNRYLLHAAPRRVDPPVAAAPAAEGKAGQFLSFIQQVPFLLSLLLLLVACWIGYNMDVILLYLARAGESTARYFLLSFATVLGVAALCTILWLVLSFILRQKKITQQQKYRQDVMERLGLVILDDNTVLDRDGRPVHTPDPQRLDKGNSEDMRLLPRIGRDG
ncbi:hypothetical protein [Geoalkalibacter sp.]|uniref:hypothetical protein n=1 Tax=Geoalkalibacter sp. TaxID=3041440 RepID=UPI00272E24DD|nr:hypothetical protein [Geoalkalibacter sp.]